MLSSSRGLAKMRAPDEQYLLLADPSVTIAAGREAALNVLRSHQATGDPVVVWRDGHVVDLDQQEIARLIEDLTAEGIPGAPKSLS
jgi:hypothetical protein